MFDLFKDIDVYGGIPPYASEHYGVYQPMLGWSSKLTKAWIKLGGTLIDPNVKRVLDGRLTPGPREVQHDHPLEFLAFPLEPASGRSPFTVLLTKDFHSELMRQVQHVVQVFVDDNDGRLPENVEWRQIVDFDAMTDPADGLLRKVNDTHRERLYKELLAQSLGDPPAEALLAVKAKHLELMQFESQMATFLLSRVEAQRFMRNPIYLLAMG